jgi:hypothetical protein
VSFGKKRARMERGWFTLSNTDGTGGDYPLLTASVSFVKADGQWWLSVQASTQPPEWTCPPDGDIPEFPAIDLGSQVAGPEPGAWAGREFTLSEERDPRTGHYPAWLYTTGGYEALSECVVSLGAVAAGCVAVRVIARGSSTRCSVRVVGEFELVLGSAQGGAEPAAVDVTLDVPDPGA